MAENTRNNGRGRPAHRAARPRKGVSRTFGESADWSDHHGLEGLYGNRPLDLLRCLRPAQWAKNLILLAAPFFACFDQGQSLAALGAVEIQVRLGWALAAFVLLSGAAYALNDVADARLDAADPQRRLRPVAARRVSPAAAVTLGVVCAAAGLGAAWLVGARGGASGAPFFWVALAYLLIQPLYTFAARRVAEVGAMLVAAGFGLRAAAGALALGVRLSPWLLVCVFLVALFVALCKRRARHFAKGARQPSVAEGRILDLEVGLCAAATVSCYTLYTLATETIAHFGTDRLVWTVPLVVLGVFRHLRLTYGEQRAGEPEAVFLRDPCMVGTIVLWVVACGLILHFA